MVFVAFRCEIGIFPALSCFAVVLLFGVSFFFLIVFCVGIFFGCCRCGLAYFLE